MYIYAQCLPQLKCWGTHHVKTLIYKMVATELFGLTRQEQARIIGRKPKPLKAIAKFMCCCCKESKPITERANHTINVDGIVLLGGKMCLVCRQRARWVADHRGATLGNPYGLSMCYKSGSRSMTSPLHPADW